MFFLSLSSRECPEELREAAAGLIYAAERCGDVPELQEVKRLMAAKFGREFVSSAAELRSGCGINAKVRSTRLIRIFCLILLAECN